jgi:nicotinamide N-methyltransferase
MLTDRITLSPTSDPEPEDYLSTSLGVIFPDDITNQHGDPSTPVIYTSPTFGRIFLSLADPVGEGSRRLFAQYLWNAGVYVAVEIEDVLTQTVPSLSPTGEGRGDEVGGGLGGGMGTSTSTGRESGRGEDRGKGKEKDPWDVRHEAVLELGAGAGLAGIIASKAGAKEVVITDYPAEEVLSNLRGNVERNLTLKERERCVVRRHEWGVVPGFDDSSDHGSNNEVFKGIVKGSLGKTSEASLEDTGAAQEPEKTRSTEPESFPAAYHQHFTRLLIADCLWLPSQHSSLHRSIAYLLSPTGYALVVAGFHTGRAKMAGFFDAEALAAVGLEVQSIVEKDPVGREREWRSREGGESGKGGDGREEEGRRENLSERKRWLVVAVLRRRREEGG